MPEANPPMPLFPGAYTLAEISIDELNKSVKPKQFLHIDQSECIMCEGCVDICPWKCIHMLSAGTVEDSLNVVAPCTDPDDHVIFVVDEDVCTRCGLCVDRCPTGVIIMGKAGVAPKDGDQHMRDNKHGYSYGIASKRPRTDSTSERTAGNHVATPMQPTIADKAAETVDNVQGSQAWGSIFRPGSIFRKGYSDSPRNPPQHPATPGTLRLAARLDAKRQLRSGHGLHAPWLREAHRVPTRK